MEVTPFAPVPLNHGFLKSELDEVLVALALRGVADITIETGKPIWSKLHGVQFKTTLRAIQEFEAHNVITWMYGANAVAEVTKGRPLDIRYEVREDGRRTIFRVNAVGCYSGRGHGVSISLRTIPAVVPELSEMLLPDDILQALHPKLGLVLIVGETGSGKSTLLAAANRYAIENIPNLKIVTYEKPIEFDLQGVISKVNSFISQREVGLGQHCQSFADGMVDALRQNPDVIMLGEARDPETIRGVFAAAESGHVTYTTVHAESVATTFLRVANEFPPDQMSQIIFKLISHVRLVVVQRLAPPLVEGQRRVAIREWLAFPGEFRRHLMTLPALEAVAEIDRMVRSRGQALSDQAHKAFAESRISEATLRAFAGDLA